VGDQVPKAVPLGADVGQWTGHKVTNFLHGKAERLGTLDELQPAY
jgi:hypothetical protein